MKNLISKEEKDQIDLICIKYKIKNYTINSDGSIDVDGDVSLRRTGLEKIPLNFNKVFGNFDCVSNKLTSLEDSPTTVGGFFYCDDNQLATLVGGPVTIGGDFYCDDNQLTSFEGVPQLVGGDFSCTRNQLTTLVGGPVNVVGSFYCDENQLTTLEGAPVTIGGDLICTDNNLASTYAGDVDIEISGEGYFDSQCLPVLFVDNIYHIKLILKYQRHFFIWNEDLTLNEDNFQDLIVEIEDGLE